MLDPWPTCPYTLLLGRAFKDYRCQVWRAYFDRPLPQVSVPLAEPDADIPLDLQPMIEAIYQRSRYAGTIDYRKPPNPPLNAEETAWLEKQLRQRQGQT